MLRLANSKLHLLLQLDDFDFVLHVQRPLYLPILSTGARELFMYFANESAFGVAFIASFPNGPTTWGNPPTSQLSSATQDRYDNWLLIVP